MIYKQFHDLNLSALGLGCMRFPVVDGKSDQIDEAETAKLVAYAMEQGINYYDTAWPYHGGMSEIVMGRLLNQYPRDSWYLATKFPGFTHDTFEKKEEVFEKQLEKCQVEYFDFYLCHNVCERNIDDFLSPDIGMMEYLVEQKKAGRIRHLGFSTHGSLETMERFIQAWAPHLEFCQIQLNWLDWIHQDAKAKVELLKKYNLPVWVMEPVRGGRLLQLSQKDKETLAALRPEESVPGWCFRFLQSIPEVTMVLSGMSNYAQLSENIATFSEEKPLNEAEQKGILTIAEGILAQKTMLCTNCKYCEPECPQGLAIPDLIAAFNRYNSDLVKPELASDPANCVGCGSCEKVCPQKIRISEVMADFAKKLG